MENIFIVTQMSGVILANQWGFTNAKIALNKRISLTEELHGDFYREALLEDSMIFGENPNINNYQSSERSIEDGNIDKIFIESVILV